MGYFALVTEDFLKRKTEEVIDEDIKSIIKRINEIKPNQIFVEEVFYTTKEWFKTKSSFRYNIFNNTTLGYRCVPHISDKKSVYHYLSGYMEALELNLT